MIDSHCHLTDLQFDGKVGDIISNFEKNGIEKVVCVGCDNESNKRAKEIANKFESVYFAVGIHPDDCDSYNEQDIENYLKNGDKKLVAVGEIGLDYFHTKENKEKQIEVFESQIRLAKKYNLPFIIHCRDAYGDTLEVLKRNAPYPDGAVVHCFSGSLEFAKEVLKLGLKISFTGSVTFNNAKNVQEVAKNLPVESIFFETDSPYLSPVPLRGTRNEPKNVKLVYEFVAGLKNIDLKELEEIVDNTAKNFFKF